MMAATSAKGETEIVNAAREPEVADLADCLIAMGARIEGAGTHRILIAGDTAGRATHTIIPDRIEAGTYAIAAAITGGQLELTHARLEQMASVVQVLEAAGVSDLAGRSRPDRLRRRRRSPASTSAPSPIRVSRRICRRSSWR
jgi:UDP-N-acetylglucosamine 1-carboxyvinyltransferase